MGATSLNRCKMSGLLVQTLCHCAGAVAVACNHNVHALERLVAHLSGNVHIFLADHHATAVNNVDGVDGSDNAADCREVERINHIAATGIARGLFLLAVAAVGNAVHHSGEAVNLSRFRRLGSFGIVAPIHGESALKLVVAVGNNKQTILMEHGIRNLTHLLNLGIHEEVVNVLAILVTYSAIAAVNIQVGLQEVGGAVMVLLIVLTVKQGQFVTILFGKHFEGVVDVVDIVGRKRFGSDNLALGTLEQVLNTIVAVILGGTEA